MEDILFFHAHGIRIVFSYFYDTSLYYDYELVFFKLFQLISCLALALESVC